MKKYEKIEEYSIAAAGNPGNWDDYSYIIMDGNAGYTKGDLLVIYKLGRLLKLNLISLEEYNHLMDLYRERLILEYKSNLDLSDDELDEIYGKIEEMDKELNRYYLSTEFVQMNYLIDESIKRENRLSLRKKYYEKNS